VQQTGADGCSRQQVVFTGDLGGRGYRVGQERIPDIFLFEFQLFFFHMMCMGAHQYIKEYRADQQHEGQPDQEIASIFLLEGFAHRDSL
jgi:hypothetical protein